MTIAERMTIGSVAPISVVGTISTAKAASEARDGEKRERGRQRRLTTRPRRCLMTSSSSGVASALSADADFDQAEGAQRRSQAPGHSSGDETADREPAHEAGEHRAGGVDRDAEHERQQAQPHHLVDERAGPREEEQEREEGKQPGGHAVLVVYRGG